MQTAVVLALLGLSVGVLIAAGRSPRDTRTLRQRAIEAQYASAEASRHARELVARWSAEQDRLAAAAAAAFAAAKESR